jgi:hypothetical protein
MSTFFRVLVVCIFAMAMGVALVDYATIYAATTDNGGGEMVESQAEAIAPDRPSMVADFIQWMNEMAIAATSDGKLG